MNYIELNKFFSEKVEKRKEKKSPKNWKKVGDNIGHALYITAGGVPSIIGVAGQRKLIKRLKAKGLSDDEIRRVTMTRAAKRGAAAGAAASIIAPKSMPILHGVLKSRFTGDEFIMAPVGTMMGLGGAVSASHAINNIMLKDKKRKKN